ncbi:cell cycle progression protein 1 isoform X2 [Tachyglossus aculeatus]|uniref:cell cycle progression protein 1 isoform X2 n=1 Tax=Tachyglossus aculeatus TaxID=9261 RepID=UPI0018F42962|nr:cell cycle progression protein 1 isoform X2 [Tachyglossus aculeatus]
MSENSSDSDSSCGWTVINHEGSDIETVNTENAGASDNIEVASGGYAVSSEQQDQPSDLGESNQGDTVPMEETGFSALEETKSAFEAKREKSPDDNVCFGAISDDSDIVTLEPPKLEEIEIQEEAVVVDEEVQGPEDFNMGSSSSSQYAFCQPETDSWWAKLWKIPKYIRGWDDHHRPGQLPLQAFSAPHSGDESSSDEARPGPSVTVRRRRARKKTVSSSESEDRPPAEQETEPPREEPPRRQLSSGLNRCIILALVMAISMGFGHFYGTIQIQKRQQLVEKLHEDELNDMKDDLFQCQQEQGSFVNNRPLEENRATYLTLSEEEKMSFETQKESLASENQHLRVSLEKEEEALSSLQDELRKLREQVRNLEDKGTSTDLIATENEKLKQHLEEEKQRTQRFLRQKETLLAEAQVLRKELDRERQTTSALRRELEQLSSGPSADDAGPEETPPKGDELETLRGRLSELERKLNFEQQRSDLWERLYVEAKDRDGKHEASEKRASFPKGAHRAKRKSKDTFFGSVKETFDAMKNSTKEFVRHHKEKIKQAKEAVKENLKKFSDSVKSTFRHFKDTTRTIFDEKGDKPHDDRRRHEEPRKARTVYGDHVYPQHKAPPRSGSPRGPRTPREGRKAKPGSEETPERDPRKPQRCTRGQYCSTNHYSPTKGCSGVFDCARQESISLFNKVLDPVKVDEFYQLMHRYLQQEVANFHHWGELERFINKFFRNNVFIHDQMLFTDFVNDVKDYLEDMKEYQIDNDEVFEDLDDYIYRHFFGDTFSPQYGPSRPAKRRLANTENAKHRKQELQRPQPQRSKREGKWPRHDRPHGRHMANLEIELGQLPFDPKY